tara:strand:- start:157 stop:444 length:288 start_codon:yes stop_codon:yes gene_type:complete
MFKKVISKKVSKLRQVTFATRLEENDDPAFEKDKPCDTLDHELIRSELEEIYNVFQHTKLHESSCVNSPKKLERNKRNSFTSLNELADNYYKTKR